jgi:dienelactone hydrolase
MRLDASLVLPSGPGPHPGVVVLSIAGTEPLVDRLVDRGYAVLTPVRRGFVDVEPLLRATFTDLAGDVRAALEHLASRPEVDADALALVAQADDAPPALMATVTSSQPAPLVLLAPPALPGVESFRRNQRWLARRAGAGADELEALDRYVDGIAEVALEESAPYVREYRLQGLRAGSDVELPRNAAFPADERQAHFFASPLWHDRLAFDPEAVFSRLSSPVLVLIGEDDANTPVEDYLAEIRRGLAHASEEDAATCIVPGRTRHAFTDDAVAAVVEWLAARVGPVGAGLSRWAPSGPCSR